MEQFPLVHWRTHDVFKAFTDATCDNEIHSSSSTKRCGATAPHLFWFSVPVQRLCNPCYQKVEASEFFLLTTLRKHYKLKPKDVAAIPIHIGIGLVCLQSHPYQFPRVRKGGGRVLLLLVANKWSKSPRQNMVKTAHHPLNVRRNPSDMIAVSLRLFCIESCF